MTVTALAAAIALAGVRPGTVAASGPATLEITVTPDATEVRAGHSVAYTIAVRSIGSGADAVRLSAVMPPGTSWHVELVAGDADDACISGIGADGVQHVACEFGELAASTAGAGRHLRLASMTDGADCGTLQLSASGTADNAPAVAAAASVSVTCPEQEELGSGSAPTPALPDTAVAPPVGDVPLVVGLGFLAAAAAAAGHASRVSRVR